MAVQEKTPVGAELMIDGAKLNASARVVAKTALGIDPAEQPRRD